MKKVSFLLLLFVSLKASTQVLYDNGKLTPRSPKFTVTPKFVVIGTWGKTNISFFFQNGTADIAGTAEQNSVIQGMQLWSAYTPLTFTQAASAGAADIVISWATGNHGDGSPFDGTGGNPNVLAHAFAPGSGFGGDVHFDDDENWTAAQRPNGAQPIDLFTVAAHEIGHSLGLDHSAVGCALMAAAYTGSHRYLAPDDIAGIRSIYGTRNPILITGQSCTGATVSIPNLGDGPTITWSSNNNLVATVNAAGVVTRVGAASGTVRITATINLPCGLAIVEFVDIRIGVPVTPTLSILTNSCFGGTDWELYLQANPSSIPAGHQYIWSVDGFDFAPTTTSTYYSYDFPPSCKNVGVRITNACGTSATTAATFCPPCGSKFMATISPNPANSIINVTIDGDTNDNNKLSPEKIHFELYDLQQNRAIKKWTMAGGFKTYKLDISGTKKGVYALNIIKGKRTETHKVFIE